MFDLRYHVASLAAVFLALIIGILVGAGLATRTDVEGSERRVLQDRIKELQQRNDDMVAQADLLAGSVRRPRTTSRTRTRR